MILKDTYISLYEFENVISSLLPQLHPYEPFAFLCLSSGFDPRSPQSYSVQTEVPGHSRCGTIKNKHCVINGHDSRVYSYRTIALV